MNWDVVRQFLNLCFGITEILKSRHYLMKTDQLTNKVEGKSK